MATSRVRELALPWLSLPPVGEGEPAHGLAGLWHFGNGLGTRNLVTGEPAQFVGVNGDPRLLTRLGPGVYQNGFGASDAVTYALLESGTSLLTGPDASFIWAGQLFAAVSGGFGGLMSRGDDTSGNGSSLRMKVTAGGEADFSYVDTTPAGFTAVTSGAGYADGDIAVIGGVKRGDTVAAFGRNGKATASGGNGGLRTSGRGLIVGVYSSTGLAQGANYPVVAAAFPYAISDDEMQSYIANPGALFIQRIWVPVSAGGGSVALEANALASASATASLTTAIPLAAGGVASASATASLTTAIRFVAAAQAGASATAALTTQIQLVAQATASATATADLTAASSGLSANAVAQATATASLTTGIALRADATAGASAAAALSTAIRLAASAAATATATATLSNAPAAFAADAIAQAQATASLTTAIRLAAAAVATASATASLSGGTAPPAPAPVAPQWLGTGGGANKKRRNTTPTPRGPTDAEVMAEDIRQLRDLHALIDEDDLILEMIRAALPALTQGTATWH